MGPLIWYDSAQVRMWIILNINYNDFHHLGKSQICAGADHYFSPSKPHSGKLWVRFVVIHHIFTLLYFSSIFTSIVNVQCLLFVLVLVLFHVCIVNCIILLFAGEVVWFRFLPYYRREGFPEVYRGHPRLPGARGAAEQGLQPVPGHVEHRGHHLRLPVRNIPLQRGRGHPRADPERILHVSSSSMEGDIQWSHWYDK